VRGAWQDSTEKASRRARLATDPAAGASESRAAYGSANLVNSKPHDFRSHLVPEKARGVWAADNLCSARRKGGMAMGRDQGGGKGVMGRYVGLWMALREQFVGGGAKGSRR